MADPKASVTGSEGPRPRVLLVGDFSASRVGNFSVSEQLLQLLEAEGVDVRATRSATASAPLRVLHMLRATVRERGSVDVAVIDVFSGRAFRWAEWAAGLLAAAGVPLVMVLRGGNLPRFAASQPARVSRLLGRARVVVALSEYLRSEIAPYVKDAVVLPNPIDVGAYPYRLREAPKPELVWLRTFHAIYNPQLAPRVLARLASRFPTASLTMYGRDKGDGSLAATLALADELGVTGELRTPGPVPKAEVPERLSRADVFLNTTNVDNVPISVLEAMACGLCVVSTDVGGMPHLIDNGRDGLLVPADDDEAMAEAVVRVLTEPGLAGRLSANARAKASAHDWSAVLPRWLELLTSAARTRGETEVAAA